MLVIVLIYFSQYPAKVKQFQYDPQFAIRGLHLDVKTVSVTSLLVVLYKLSYRDI